MVRREPSFCDEAVPRTTELLQGIGTVKAAMFATLPPGAKLVRHRDPYAGSYRYHLGLDTPNDDGCYIDVDGEKYAWRDGEAVVFDETYIHYAANTTEHNRIILFCDVERPLKYRWATAFNRWFSRNVMAAAAAPNDANDKTGGINRLFTRIYKIRERGKALKSATAPATTGKVGGGRSLGAVLHLHLKCQWAASRPIATQARPLPKTSTSLKAPLRNLPKVKTMSMMDWDAYRKQLMAGIGDLKQLSPDTVAGYMTASGAGAKTNHLDAKTRELISSPSP